VQKIKVSIQNSLYVYQKYIVFYFVPDKILLHDLATRLDGLANTAMVEVGDGQLAGYFAEQRFSQQPFFRNGMSR
jgi:hypothetical protein